MDIFDIRFPPAVGRDRVSARTSDAESLRSAWTDRPTRCYSTGRRKESHPMEHVLTLLTVSCAVPIVRRAQLVQELRSSGQRFGDLREPLLGNDVIEQAR